MQTNTLSVTKERIANLTLGVTRAPHEMISSAVLHTHGEVAFDGLAFH